MKALPRWSLTLVFLLGVSSISFFILDEAMHGLLQNRLVDTDTPLAIASLIVLGLTLDTFLPVPSSLLGVAAGIKLGFWPGLASVWIGLSLGGLIGYGLGYGLSGAGLRRFLGEREYASVHALVQRVGVPVLALTRAAPLLAETAVIAAGIARMPLRLFLPVLFLANAGVALVYTALGAQADAGGSALVAGLGGLVLPGLWWGYTQRWLGTRAGAAPSTGGTIRARFAVTYDYPVHFVQNAFNTRDRTLASCIAPAADKPARFAAVVDANLALANPSLIPALRRYAEAHAERIVLACEPIVFPAGEAAKNDPELTASLHRKMLQLGLDRHETVLAIGGGALLDCVGFATATFHRGLRLVRMPTTVLAQNDAGIGVKNGVNAYGSKNLIGCFAPPAAVVNDLNLLDSLPADDRRSGMAEAVKVALIRDRDFFLWIEAHAARLAEGDRGCMQYLIRRCAELHLAQITGAGDPFERGTARPLDYGHWVAHKLESLSGHRLRHGDAVTLGIALDSHYAALAGLLPEAEANRVQALLSALGFQLWHPLLDLADTEGRPLFLQGLEEFRAHLGGALTVTLLNGLGRAVEVHSMQQDLILAARERLRSACD